MSYLFKCMSILLLFFALQACSTADKTDIEKANDEMVTTATTDQTKKKGIVLIDDNGKLGDLFKSGGDELGSVNKYLWQASTKVFLFSAVASFKEKKTSWETIKGLSADALLLLVKPALLKPIIRPKNARAPRIRIIMSILLKSAIQYYLCHNVPSSLIDLKWIL